MAQWQTLFAHTQNSPTSRPSRRWTIAAALAFAGALQPLPIPLTGIHKFYLGQPIWGALYLVLGWTQIPRIACAIEGIWYLTRARQSEFYEATPTVRGDDSVTVSQQTQAIATALRELDTLRQEGLISEHEFEQNRRRLLERLS